MSAPTPNAALLRAGLARVEEHPEEWEQSSWRCETGGCFAYHVVMVATEDEPNWEKPHDTYNDHLVTVPEDNAPGRRIVPLPYRAQRLLGLDDEQAEELFESFNTLDDLRRIVNKLAALDPSDEGGAQ